MEEIKIHTAGDSSVLIEFGQEISPEINAKITAFVHLMKAQHVEGVKDMIPAFTSLLINYDPRVVNYGALKERLEKLLKLEVSQETAPSRIFDIPVCYGGEYGPDLENIAMHANLSTQEVIDIHSSEDYLIYMLGFLPGFSYLGGLDERIHTPDKNVKKATISIRKSKHLKTSFPYFSFLNTNISFPIFLFPSDKRIQPCAV